MNRTTETAISAGGGSQIAYQIVEVLEQVDPGGFFTQYPALSGLTLTIITLLIALPASYGFAKRGRNKN